MYLICLYIAYLNNYIYYKVICLNFIHEARFLLHLCLSYGLLNSDLSVNLLVLSIITLYVSLRMPTVLHLFKCSSNRYDYDYTFNCHK